MPPRPRNTVTLAFIVSIGGFLFGFDASVISGVVSFIIEDFGIGDWELGLVVGAPTLGGVVAALAMGPLSDAIGRRKTLLFIASLYTLSAGFSAFAFSYESLVIARFLGGLAFGSLMIAPIYIAEISPAASRGRFVSINQLNIVLGFSAAYFANFAVLKLSQSDLPLIRPLMIDEHPWRWMLGLEFIPALAYVLLLLKIPESPRWLASKNRHAEAAAIFTSLNLDPGNSVSDPSLRESAGNAVPLRELFAPRVRFALFIGLIVGIAQQVTGINAVYFYAPTIFEESGVGTDAAFAQAIWIGIVNVVFTLLSMALIDRVGRRPLMIAGLCGTSLSLFLAAYGFSGSEQNPILVLVGILGFVASFAFSLGPVMWVVLSEIFPARIRGLCMAAIGIANSGISFLVQLAFPRSLSAIGVSSTFFAFALCSLISLVLVAIFLPETRGKSLERIEAELS